MSNQLLRKKHVEPTPTSPRPLTSRTLHRILTGTDFATDNRIAGTETLKYRHCVSPPSSAAALPPPIVPSAQRASQPLYLSVSEQHREVMRSLRERNCEPRPTFVDRLGPPLKASRAVIDGRSVHTLFPTRSAMGYSALSSFFV